MIAERKRQVGPITLRLKSRIKIFLIAGCHLVLIWLMALAT